MTKGTRKQKRSYLPRPAAVVVPQERPCLGCTTTTGEPAANISRYCCAGEKGRARAGREQIIFTKEHDNNKALTFRNRLHPYRAAAGEPPSCVFPYYWLPLLFRW